jgi:nicotinamidase/pyrazinamidase
VRALFWDVDTQVDFMLPRGSLYIPGAEQLIPNLARLTAAAHARGIRVLASADDHVPQHREISDRPDYEYTFPPHCMRGTPGQCRIPETALREPLVLAPDAPFDPERAAAHRGDFLLLKHRADVFSTPLADALLRVLDPGVITLYGVALDIGVRSTVEGLLTHWPGVSLRVVSDAVCALDRARGHRLRERWRLRGVALVTTAEVLRTP